MSQGAVSFRESRAHHERANMEYKKLVVVAPAWREEFDPATNTLYLRAEFSARGYCETIMTPIPGTDPVEYEYTCLPVTCEGKCELTTRSLPDGTIVVFCACLEGGGPESTALTSASTRRKTTGKNKSAGKGKGRRKGKSSPRKR
jgi:hypothetical protein